MKFHVDIPPGFDFLECINAHGWRSLAPFSWDAESKVLERVEEVEPGVAAVMRIEGEIGSIAVDCMNAGLESNIVRRVRRMLQLDVSMDDFHSYCTCQPKLKHVPAKRQGRMLRSPTLFEDVLKVVATTNTTWLQTKAMVARIVEHFGTPLPGDSTRKTFPRPEQLACVPIEEFAAMAKMGYRNAAAHRIASDIVDGRLDLESWQDTTIESADLYKRLLSLPGVGPYAASCLMIYLGRYDRVNVDSWARMMVGKELGRPVTDKEAHVFFEPYGQWRGLVYHFFPWREAEPEY